MKKNLKNIQTFEQHTDKNLNISGVIVRLFTDLARKHNISVNDIDLTLQGEELVVYKFNEIGEEMDELERININEL